MLQLQHIPVPTKHNDPAQRDKRTIEARKRLGITPEQMQLVPRISHLLALAENGVDGCIAALRLSDDQDALKFLAKYDSISASDRGRLTVEEICVASEVPVKNFLAAAMVAIEYLGKSAAAMATASFYGPVIKSTAEAAINGKNATANRKLFLSGAGFLPRPANREPGGVFVNITNQNANDARKLHEAAEQPKVVEVEITEQPYRPAEDELKSLHGEIDSARMLSAPKVENEEAVEIGETFKEEFDCIPSGK